MDSRFEWAAHEPEALKEGVPADIIDIIKHRKSTQGLDETYAAIIEFGRQIFRDHKVTSEAFARVKAKFPPTNSSNSCCSWATTLTAALLCAFDMQVPEGKPRAAGWLTQTVMLREGGAIEVSPGAKSRSRAHLSLTGSSAFAR